MASSFFDNGFLFFDGGFGSELIKRGLQPGELTETWNLRHPEAVKEIHTAYLNAGANIVTANTFGANPFKYPAKMAGIMPSAIAGKTGTAGVPVFTELDGIITAAIRNAKEAIAEFEKSCSPFASKKHYAGLDIGSLGKLLAPFGDLDFEEAYEAFSQVVRLGERAGADLIEIETMNDLYELKAAVLAAKSNSSLPVFATVTFDASGKLLTGADADVVVATLEGLGVDALGVNCGLGPDELRPIVDRILEISSVPVIVNPNAGLPQLVDGRTVYNVGAEEFAGKMKHFALAGARGLGGCCGTTPEHITALVNACKDIQPVPVTGKNLTVVASYGKTVLFDKRPLIIGERINPTGKAKLKAALRENDTAYILSEAAAQLDAGADLLDVNTGLPGIDEPEVLKNTICALQEITDCPLQIDTSDVNALERSLRIYNGKALINSVNGKQEVMDAVFPLAKKYGGVTVALLLDENGIPETVEGRISVARKIISRAAEYGIEKKDLIFDALCTTVSTDKNAARVTLDTVKYLRSELGVHTILGVSNISFGLPGRELINSTFLTLALENGLSAAIMNPLSERMMQSFDSFLVLNGLDANCSRYIVKYADYVPLSAATSNSTANKDVSNGTGNTAVRANGVPAGTLSSCRDTVPGTLIYDVCRGLKEAAADKVREMLGISCSSQSAGENSCTKGAVTAEPLDIINSHLIPALDLIGRDFETGRLFLPQLMSGAEAAKACFSVINEKMASDGGTKEKKYKIIMATVKGDIHDIGKNIVCTLLENYGYDVIDMGKDVAPEAILEKAVAENVKLVGLSALMTTTVPAMAETIKLFRAKKPDTKIIVGGAVITADYAKEIGADAYGSDALATVKYAESLL